MSLLPSGPQTSNMDRELLGNQCQHPADLHRWHNGNSVSASLPSIGANISPESGIPSNEMKLTAMVL